MSPDEGRLRDWGGRAAAFTAEARSILAATEASTDRLITLEASYANLDALSIKQDDLLRQALRCVEHGLFRAAHVMAWAAFMDYLEEKIAFAGMVMLKMLRPKWTYDSMEELREYVSEYQIIETTQGLGLCSKNQMKALHGLLNKRNECAHPSDYYPELNDALGYISEVLQRLKILQAKTL